MATVERVLFAMLRGGAKAIPIAGGIFEEVIRVIDDDRAEREKLARAAAPDLERTIGPLNDAPVADATLEALATGAFTALPPQERRSFEERALALGREASADARRELGRALALDLNRRLLDQRAVQEHLRAAATLAPGYSAERALSRGTLVGDRYCIERELGQGGMGRVYSATDTRFDDMRVAIKVVVARAAAERQRFRREANIGRRLGYHPGFVRTIDRGDLPGGAEYLVMELVDDAEPLDLAAGSLEERLARLVEAARLVATVHARGVVHRDLKPANFLRSRQGVLHLADFGLAKVLGQQDDLQGAATTGQLTMAGTGAMGTLPFMPPEQLEDFSSADFRSDVFALGVMLFYALRAEYPFGSRMTEVVVRHHEARTRPPDVGPCDEAIRDLCLHALAIDRQRRLDSAATFADRLARALAPAAGSSDRERGARKYEEVYRRFLADGVLTGPEEEALGHVAEVHELAPESVQAIRSRVDADPAVVAARARASAAPSPSEPAAEEASSALGDVAHLCRALLVRALEEVAPRLGFEPLGGTSRDELEAGGELVAFKAGPRQHVSLGLAGRQGERVRLVVAFWSENKRDPSYRAARTQLLADPALLDLGPGWRLRPARGDVLSIEARRWVPVQELAADATLDSAVSALVLLSERVARALPGAKARGQATPPASSETAAAPDRFVGDADDMKPIVAAPATEPTRADAGAAAAPLTAAESAEVARLIEGAASGRAAQRDVGRLLARRTAGGLVDVELLRETLRAHDALNTANFTINAKKDGWRRVEGADGTLLGWTIPDIEAPTTTTSGEASEATDGDAAPTPDAPEARDEPRSDEGPSDEGPPLSSDEAANFAPWPETGRDFLVRLRDQVAGRLWFVPLDVSADEELVDGRLVGLRLGAGKSQAIHVGVPVRPRGPWVRLTVSFSSDNARKDPRYRAARDLIEAQCTSALIPGWGRLKQPRGEALTIEVRRWVSMAALRDDPALLQAVADGVVRLSEHVARHLEGATRREPLPPLPEQPPGASDGLPVPW